MGLAQTGPQQQILTLSLVQPSAALLRSLQLLLQERLGSFQSPGENPFLLVGGAETSGDVMLTPQALQGHRPRLPSFIRPCARLLSRPRLSLPRAPPSPGSIQVPLP